MDSLTTGIADVFPLPGSTDKCKPPRHDTRSAEARAAFFSRVPAISSWTGLLKWGVGAARTDYALVGGGNGMTLTPPHFLDSVRPPPPALASSG